ncbi:hypothetical protein [Cricetibacter osteomyelitidis]|uniref:hypothetical protein n=1 Tax=Cricetibacter osteomyelitidis TaxID=1521931 RepID=UPI0010473F83|nr:hypothetical protein [Cricetibacter osteomyelitidis]
MDKIKELKNILAALMDDVWFALFLLIVTYIDVYFSVKYNVSIIIAMEDMGRYFTNPIDYLYMILLFSMIFICLFPILKIFYIFILSDVLQNIGFNIYRSPYDIKSPEDYKNYCYLDTAILNAVKANNNALMQYCDSKKQRFIRNGLRKKAIWGMLFLFVFYYLLSNNGGNPILIQLYIDFLAYAEETSKILSVSIIITSLFPLFYILNDLFVIESEYIYLPENNKK